MVESVSVGGVASGGVDGVASVSGACIEIESYMESSTWL